MNEQWWKEYERLRGEYEEAVKRYHLDATDEMSVYNAMLNARRALDAYVRTAAAPRSPSYEWMEQMLDKYVDREYQLTKEIERLRAAAAPSTAECGWAAHYDGSDTWAADCGVEWTFFDGGPAENRMKHCPGCGSPVVVRGGAAPGGERTP